MFRSTIRCSRVVLRIPLGLVAPALAGATAWGLARAVLLVRSGETGPALWFDALLSDTVFPLLALFVLLQTRGRPTLLVPFLTRRGGRRTAR